MGLKLFGFGRIFRSGLGRSFGRLFFGRKSVDGGAVKIFAGETGRLARALAEVAKIVAADFGAADNLNLLDERRMNQEGLFYTNAGSDFADDDARSVGILAIDTDDDTLEYLRAELLAFFNLLGNLYGVTRADVDDGRFFLGFTNLL